MIMILLFKVGYFRWGGPSFGLIAFVLSILVALFLLGVVLQIIHELFCKLTGVNIGAMHPVQEWYLQLTNKNLIDEEYEGPLYTLVLWLVGLSGASIWVLLIVYAAVKNSMLLTLFDVFVFAPVYIFAFALFRHFYPRFLYKKGRRAQWHLAFAIALISVSWIAVIQTMIAQSPSYKIRKFDRIIESCERSETVETDFFAGFRVGMTAKEFNAVADSLCQKGLVRWDSTGTGNRVRLAYLGYNSYKNNYCILSVSPTFYKGDEYLYHIGFGLVRGSDHAFRTEVVERLGQEGWRQLDLPGSCFDDGVKLPKYQVRMLSDPENLYNDQDKVYVKDNMMVVVRPYVVDFYDMPTFAQRPYWNNTY